MNRSTGVLTVSLYCCGGGETSALAYSKDSNHPASACAKGICVGAPAGIGVGSGASWDILPVAEVKFHLYGKQTSRKQKQQIQAAFLSGRK